VRIRRPESRRRPAGRPAGAPPARERTRLINTPYVRKKIGLEIKSNSIKSLGEKTEKSLAQIVEDFGAQYKTVSDIKLSSSQISYHLKVDKLRHFE
jgi:hypothetical protein